MIYQFTISTHTTQIDKSIFRRSKKENFHIKVYKINQTCDWKFDWRGRGANILTSMVPGFFIEISSMFIDQREMTSGLNCLPSTLCQRKAKETKFIVFYIDQSEERI